MELEYPPLRRVIPFEEWLQKSYEGGEFCVEDHFETRATYAEYVVLTWEDPAGTLLRNFDLHQIGSGMRRQPHVFMDGYLPRRLRNRAWIALDILFIELFEKHCSNILSHCNESVRETKGLDVACYMWWDISPYFPSFPGVEAVDNALFLAVCKRCLRSSNAAVQESALHGLGHAVGYFRRWEAAGKLIDGFINGGWATRPELVRYAYSARKGKIE
jgi:hypothetical protein